jgi:hypothetical protein
MKDMPQIDSYLYLFVVYLTAMPVVQILSLLKRMQVTYEVWRQCL